MESCRFIFAEGVRTINDPAALLPNPPGGITYHPAPATSLSLDHIDELLRWCEIVKDNTLSPGEMARAVAIALQEDGWWIRSRIIWAKPNPMPESVTDRPTKSHERQ
jgi:hypothetical protein